MLDLLANTGLGSCLVLVLGLAAMWCATSPSKKKPEAATSGDNTNTLEGN